MKVLKFGGTSVGSVDSILSVKKIVEAIEEPVIVVVSALGGITDKLLKTASMATNGDVAYEREFSEIVARHLDVIQGVIPDKTKRIEVQKQVMALLDELGNIYKGVYLINDLSAKTSDTIVSYGERISSLIVSNVINEAKLFDSRKFIKTVKQFNKHIVDFELTNRLIEETFDPLPKVSLVPGFISSSKEGEVTNLGRGGTGKHHNAHTADDRGFGKEISLYDGTGSVFSGIFMPVYFHMIFLERTGRNCSIHNIT